jgi:hypothetical protein
VRFRQMIFNNQFGISFQYVDDYLNLYDEAKLFTFFVDKFVEKTDIQGLTYGAKRTFFDLIDNLAVVLWHIYHVLIAALNLYLNRYRATFKY